MNQYNEAIDEYTSWKAALVVMLFVSLLSLGLRFVFSIEFFRIEFEIGLVHVPTVLLLGVWLLESRRKTGSALSGSSL